MDMKNIRIGFSNLIQRLIIKLLKLYFRLLRSILITLYFLFCLLHMTTDDFFILFL